MHYVRFLKPPRLLPGSPPSLGAKITVTTDLGESFLWRDVSLVVELESETGSIIGKWKEYTWKGTNGMRSLEVSMPIIPKTFAGILKMVVGPKDPKYTVDKIDFLGQGRQLLHPEDDGGIVAVRSMSVALSPGIHNQKTSISLAERVFTSDTNVDIHIWEETGESIARHIWDAGLVLSSYLTTIRSKGQPEPSKLPKLAETLSKKDRNILELGAGCGIVGITISKHFPTSQVLLTDLDEATEILTHNLSILNQTFPKQRTSHQVLDWSEPIPATISSRNWDLVVVADCTYNPDVVPDLVNTLNKFAEKNPHIYILLAMKVRHDSEMVFFELMKNAGFKIEERMSLPLPVLGGEKEAIDIFGFTFGSR